MPEIFNEPIHVSNVPSDTFSSIMNEAASYFSDQGIAMTSKNGIEEIISDNSLFETYKQKLCEGLEPSQIDSFAQLMNNTRKTLLEAASVSGVDQIAGLSMPTIRKMWAKIALKHVMPTTVVSTPSFKVAYTKAYLFKDGKKYELPDAINKTNNHVELPKLLCNVPDVNNAYVLKLPLQDEDLFGYASVPASAKTYDSIDRKFYLDYVHATAPTYKDENGTTHTGEDVWVRVRVQATLDALINAVVKIPVQQTDATTGRVTTYGYATDTVFGSVDYSEGKLTLISTGGIIDYATLDARITHETNENTESVSFDIINEDITIGTGAHLNAPLPIEWLQDTMAVYNIDGAAEVIDLMSQTVAQKLELEIYNFLNDSIDENNVPYIGSFNVIPSVGYNGTPKSWREELKTVIDSLAIRMKRDSKFHSGKFAIIGSPLDMQLLPNVDWVFDHVKSENDGVEVTFNLGAMSGANRYELVSSDLIPDGALIMFFIPATDRFLTYKYYPYTFNVEKGYRDSQMSLVPSIMMTKRHTLKCFTPLISRIVIKNNTGFVPETPGY